MENASKALIIAGAILLAIVLVSLGVLVINNARSEIDGQGIDQASIESFNAKIMAYCGSNKSGTDMNNLVDVITASNGAQVKKDVQHYITLKWAGKEWKGGVANTENYPVFQNNRKYVAAAMTSADGYINVVEITAP